MNIAINVMLLTVVVPLIVFLINVAKNELPLSRAAQERHRKEMARAKLDLSLAEYERARRAELKAKVIRHQAELVSWQNVFDAFDPLPTPTPKLIADPATEAVMSRSKFLCTECQSQIRSRQFKHSPELCEGYVTTADGKYVECQCSNCKDKE